MRRLRLMTRRWITAVSLILVILALAIWTIRPSPFFDWLGAAGLVRDSPLMLIRGWATGALAPMTPLGLISLFPIADLASAAFLLTALSMLLVVFPAVWWDKRPRSWLTDPLSMLRTPPIRLRVRTALALIAILGIYLGWEIVAGRAWRQRQQYLSRVAFLTLREALYRELLYQVESELAALDGAYLVSPENTRTAAARAAELACKRDTLGQLASERSALAVAYAQLRRTYERAAAEPLRPVPPDPPLPAEQRQPWPSDWMMCRESARALARFDALIQAYPDLVGGHERRAWILATCPDARFRDGKLAIAAATRAGELTNWKDGLVLSTLAAAYAEEGDFASAVQWQERAMKQALGLSPSGNQDRLALYKAGKPFRMQAR